MFYQKLLLFLFLYISSCLIIWSNPKTNNQYEWYDGSHVNRIWLLEDLIAEVSTEKQRKETPLTRTKKNIVHETFKFRVLLRTDVAAFNQHMMEMSSEEIQYLPVFKNRFGYISVLLNEVVLMFHKEVSEKQQKNFFIEYDFEDINLQKLMDLTYRIITKPGFDTLELANDLTQHEYIKSCTPNWWVPVNKL